jgi:hypothetical protein
VTASSLLSFKEFDGAPSEGAKNGSVRTVAPLDGDRRNGVDAAGRGALKEKFASRCGERRNIVSDGETVGSAVSAQDGRSGASASLLSPAREKLVGEVIASNLRTSLTTASHDRCCVNSHYLPDSPD